MGSVDKGAGSINYVNMPSSNRLLQLWTHPVSANSHNVTPYIIHTLDYPDPSDFNIPDTTFLMFAPALGWLPHTS
ncbi:unnamed protein product, partial [marine sediment metagenome]